jgi:hypothetical protein
MQDTLLSNQVGISVLAVYALEWAKRTEKISWVSANTDRLNRVIAVVVAFLTSVGFQFAMTGSWLTGGVLTVTIPSLPAIVSVLLHSLAQVGIQESFYRAAVKR